MSKYKKSKGVWRENIKKIEHSVKYLGKIWEGNENLYSLLIKNKNKIC